MNSYLSMREVWTNISLSKRRIERFMRQDEEVIQVNLLTYRASTLPTPFDGCTPASMRCLATIEDKTCFGFLKLNKEARSRCLVRKKAWTKLREACIPLIIVSHSIDAVIPPAPSPAENNGRLHSLVPGISNRRKLSR